MAAPHWRYESLYYVKLYTSVNGTKTWLGWLGEDLVESNYAKSVGGDEAGPPPEGATRVQWVYDAQRGDATNEAEYQAALNLRPRYLSSCGRVLGGTTTGGFECYWWNTEITEGYPLAAAVADVNLVTLSRQGYDDPAGSVIHTYGDKLGYSKDGDQWPVWFELIPATTIHPGAHPTWMSDMKAVIQDRPLAKIVIPGSHDAGIYELSRSGGEMNSRTQQVSILDQLLAGARYLDIRVDMYQGVWYTRHGSDWTWVRFDHVVEQLGSFLDDHPEEVVLVALLVCDTKGVDGSQGDNRNAWQMLFNRVHSHHLSHVNGQESVRDLTKLAPRHMREQGSNLLVFSWGEPTNWNFYVDDISGEYCGPATMPVTPAGLTKVFVSPWPSKPEGGTRTDAIADLEGVYLGWESTKPTAQDLYDYYKAYPETTGVWNFQTNLPYKSYDAGESVYQKHERVTPPLIDMITDGLITRSHANIINMDYLGDTLDVKGVPYDFVSKVISLNE